MKLKNGFLFELQTFRNRVHGGQIELLSASFRPKVLEEKQYFLQEGEYVNISVLLSRSLCGSSVWMNKGHIVALSTKTVKAELPIVGLQIL